MNPLGTTVEPPPEPITNPLYMGLVVYPLYGVGASAQRPGLFLSTALLAAGTGVSTWRGSGSLLRGLAAGLGAGYLASMAIGYGFNRCGRKDPNYRRGFLCETVYGFPKTFQGQPLPPPP